MARELNTIRLKKIVIGLMILLIICLVNVLPMICFSNAFADEIYVQSCDAVTKDVCEGGSKRKLCKSNVLAGKGGTNVDYYEFLKDTQTIYYKSSPWRPDCNIEICIKKKCIYEVSFSPNERLNLVQSWLDKMLAVDIVTSSGSITLYGPYVYEESPPMYVSREPYSKYPDNGLRLNLVDGTADVPPSTSQQPKLLKFSEMVYSEVKSGQILVKLLSGQTVVGRQFVHYAKDRDYGYKLTLIPTIHGVKSIPKRELEGKNPQLNWMSVPLESISRMTFHLPGAAARREHQLFQ